VVDDDRSRRLERARGVLREVTVVARESGIMLALENLPPKYLGHTPDEIMTLLEDLDREAIGVCFDTGHANLSGRFKEFADALLPISVTTHIHDNDGMADQHQFPGAGTIDWYLFAATYRASDCSANMMLECMPPEGVTWSEAFQRFRTALGG